MEEGDRGSDQMEMSRDISMKNISEKKIVRRRAKAEGCIILSEGSIENIFSGVTPKGDAIATAQIAGINAAKLTPYLIPLCHQIPLSSVKVTFERMPGRIRCVSEVEANWGTGVEMDALLSVSTALLALWDMVKENEKDERGQYPSTSIEGIRVIEKEKEGM
jgi:cyclic pyranopterin phosphate synthase